MAWLDEASGGDTHRRRGDFEVVWWVEAETAEGRDAAFARLAVKLGLPEATAPGMAVTRGAVVEWMNHQPGRLVVFDNAESPESLTGWLPPAPRGRTLITSRDRN